MESEFVNIDDDKLQADQDRRRQQKQKQQNKQSKGSYMMMTSAMVQDWLGVLGGGQGMLVGSTGLLLEHC
jgi:hypothetical protein